jgi:predicted XRE-type DNA-binding protein
MVTKAKSPVKIKAEKSSGNVFGDLGFLYPEQELLKAKLTLEIYRLIKRRDLTQVEAGKILGIKEPHVSTLMRNRSGAAIAANQRASSPRHARPPAPPVEARAPEPPICDAPPGVRALPGSTSAAARA